MVPTMEMVDAKGTGLCRRQSPALTRAHVPRKTLVADRLPRSGRAFSRQPVPACQRLSQSLRQQLVGAARFGDTGRVTVRQDHSGRVVLKSRLHYFALVNTGLRRLRTRRGLPPLG